MPRGPGVSCPWFFAVRFALGCSARLRLALVGGDNTAVSRALFSMSISFCMGDKKISPATRFREWLGLVHQGKGLEGFGELSGIGAMGLLLLTLHAGQMRPVKVAVPVAELAHLPGGELDARIRGELPQVGVLNALGVGRGRVALALTHLLFPLLRRGDGEQLLGTARLARSTMR